MRDLKITNTITARSNSTTKYFNEISSIELLNSEQEAILARRIKKGDQKAMNELIKANLRFVISVANQYHQRGTELSDLIQAGNEGIIIAAKHFDHTRGFKFISYAVWWIRQKILTEVHQNKIIRLPDHKVHSITKQKREFEKKRQQFFTGLSEELDRTNEVEPVAHVAKFLSDPLGKDENDEFGDLLSNHEEDGTDTNLLKESLTETLYNVFRQRLSEREAKILCQYFGIGTQPQFLEDIGKSLNLTRERIRQIRDAAIKKLRNCKALLEFLN